MQVSSEPRSLLLLGGNDARGQTLALVLYAPWPMQMSVFQAIGRRFFHEAKDDEGSASKGFDRGRPLGFVSLNQDAEHHFVRLC
jgi:hypothetical protein